MIPSRQAVVAEAVGTAMLVAAVVGSGIMGERLAGGDVAVALLANTIATGAALVAILLALGPVSGAHLNPVVTLYLGGVRGRLGLAAAYVGAQLVGAALGAVAANAMFELPAVELSHHVRRGAAQWLGEGIATFGLVGVIIGTGRRRPGAVPAAVAAYIVAAYWFTSSTSFANPAVTCGRILSDSFAGIRPADAPGFILAQLVGGGLGAALFGWLVPVDEPASG
ncbi:MAG: aquaporin [Kofleriaceae bacterium]